MPGEKPQPDAGELAKLEALLRSQGVPRTAWPGTIAKMVDGVRTALAACVDDAGLVSSEGRRRYDLWRAKRAARIRAARQPHE